ncbi:hypothetical protein CHLRE_15g639500v5 [Chlamydomonas reinhardtii]|uniref:Uncharacterized protein n=1 Tax=Chlamydomonas reinhardtii TaxID=3055 RepID=A0A2K3CWP9_CHLRE|nr:uncharacterized protein CHLRE_15g639500v5 [Chlamydomonas reinhardtii]PNW72706.1 hypothetical protein CHLRE_15g639500v5 [Chlamydomonas reinhardtii]
MGSVEDQQNNEWKRLTPDLVRRVAEAPCLHPNEVATGLRLVDSDTAAALRDQYCVIKLGQKRADPSEPHRAQQPWPGHAFVAHWDRPEPWRSLSLPQRRRLLCLAASSGHAPSLDAALAQCGCSLIPEVLTAAAAAGNLEGCERLLSEGCFREATSAVEAAGQGGHLQVLQLLLKKAERGARAAYYAVAVRGACAGGQLHVLQWMQDTHGFRPKARHVVLAAEYGQVKVMELLLPQVQAELAPAQPGQGQHGQQGQQGQQGQEGQPGQQGPAPPGDASRRHEAFRLLVAITLGCPLEVLQRHYDTLRRWSGGPAAAGHAGHHQQQQQQEGLGLGLGAAAGNVGGITDWPERQQNRLLMAAAASPTPDWAAKVEFLRSAWGPDAAAAVAASVGDEHELWGVLFERPDCLARLQYLHSIGVSMATPVLSRYAASAGRPEELAYMWDECGQVDGVSAAALLKDCVFGAGTSEPLVMRFLHGRGFQFTALQAEREAQLGASDATLLFLSEVVVDSMDGEEADAGGVGPRAQEARVEEKEERSQKHWSCAFRNAAERGVSLAVLQALRSRGATVDLEAVAMGGSVEALEWAAAELGADGGGRALQALLNAGQQQRVFHSGNTATVEWLISHGLLQQ